MHHRLVNGVGNLVGEDAGGEARDDLGGLSKQRVSSLPPCPPRLLRTLCSFAAQRTLSLIRQLSRRKVNLYFMFLKRPPTRAAR